MEQENERLAKVESKLDIILEVLSDMKNKTVTVDKALFELSLKVNTLETQLRICGLSLGLVVTYIVIPFVKKALGV